MVTSGPATRFAEQRLSDEEQAALIRRLQSYSVIRIRRLEDETLIRLREAYIRAAQEMSRTLQDTFLRFGATFWSITDVGQPQRQAFLFQQMIERIDTLTTRVALDMRDSWQQVYREAYQLRMWELAQGSPIASVLTLPVLPEQAIIAAMVFPYEGANFFDRLGDARLDFITKLRRSITTSQVLGEGVYAAQKRLAAELGWPIRRRTKAMAVANKGNFARTEMIARTELLRASNLGAAAVDAANADILRGWEWITARDDRVCPICGPLDGRIWPIGQGERPPRHARCRCNTIPVRKSNRELGLPEVPSVFPPRETFADWRARAGR